MEAKQCRVSPSSRGMVADLPIETVVDQVAVRISLGPGSCSWDARVVDLEVVRNPHFLALCSAEMVAVQEVRCIARWTTTASYRCCCGRISGVSPVS